MGLSMHDSRFFKKLLELKKEKYHILNVTDAEFLKYMMDALIIIILSKMPKFFEISKLNTHNVQKTENLCLKLLCK